MLASEYDEKCDVWSAGIILYLLLCGEPPFMGRSERETIKRVREGRYSMKQAASGRVSWKAKDLIKKKE